MPAADNRPARDGHDAAARQPGPPAAVVFAVLAAGDEDGEERERLGEIRELVESADMDVVGEVVQHKARPDPRAYLGPGKLNELREAVRRRAAPPAPSAKTT